MSTWLAKIPIFLLLTHCLNSCVRNVHIALGDRFADPSSDVVYRVGFMLEDQKSRACLEDLKLVLTFPDKSTAQIAKASDVREYSLHAENVFTRGKITIINPIEIDRIFAFFELKNLKNASEFAYHFEHQGKVVRGPYSFKTRILTDPAHSKIVTYGDQSNVNLEIFSYLQDKEVDLVVLTGDYAYDIHWNANPSNKTFDGSRGDDYFDKAEGLFTRAPIALIAGNHENADNFRFYEARFTFPLTNASASVHNYHFVVGGALFVGWNYDTTYTSPEAFAKNFAQLRSTIERYEEDPAIKYRIFFAHRPFYCSNLVHFTKGIPMDCLINPLLFKQLDDLLLKHKFTLSLTSHQHYFERSHKLANYEHDAQGMYYLVMGAGGNAESALGHELPRTAYRAAEVDRVTGFTLLELNDEGIFGQYIDVNNAKVGDSFVAVPNLVRAEGWNVKLVAIVASQLAVVLALGAFLHLRRKKRADRGDECENELVIKDSN